MTFRPDEVFLLVVPQQRMIFAATTGILRQAQGRTRTVRDRTVGSLLISRDGRVRRIADVAMLGPAGEGHMARLLSLLSGVQRVRVELENLPEMELAEVKELIIKYLGHDAQLGDPNIPLAAPLDDVSRHIRNADSVEEIFDTLRLPPPQDCLDVL